MIALTPSDRDRAPSLPSFGPQLASIVHTFADGRAVFLATDGRNRDGGALVDEVKGRVRAMGTRIVELTDSQAAASKAVLAGFDGAMVSELEQAVCQLSKVEFYKLQLPFERQNFTILL